MTEEVLDNEQKKQKFLRDRGWILCGHANWQHPKFKYKFGTEVAISMEKDKEKLMNKNLSGAKK